MATRKPKFGEELSKNLLLTANVKHNAGVINFTRVFIAVLAGVVAGILGFTGYVGFAFLLACELLGGVVLYVKTGGEPKKYFRATRDVFVGQLFSSVTILTFILFWTVSNNVVHLF